MGVTPRRRATAPIVTASRPSASAMARLASSTSRRSIPRGRAIEELCHGSSHSVGRTHMAYTYGMRVLLSEGSGLTSRQAADRLRGVGHEVGALSSERLGLARFTRAVTGWHAVPRVSADPAAWLAAAITAYRSGGYDVLLPTQEQVAVLAARPDRLAAAGVVT